MDKPFLVQKFGGTSVASPARLQKVAKHIAKAQAEFQVVAVVSAMGQTTDRLLSLADKVNPAPPAREIDQLLSTGETVTAPLLAMALQRIGIAAISLTGMQAGIRTSRLHRSARILDVVPQRIVEECERDKVVVVAGFQGFTDGNETTTLGRGGSDTTAVALAAALHAQRCDIYTDVAGVYTADPRIVSRARPMPEIAYEEMMELAAVGAKVLHPRAVEVGEAYSVPILVRSTFSPAAGTLICRYAKMEDRQKVRGIAHDNDAAKITMVGVPDRPGIAASIFSPLGEAGINVDIIVQNVSHSGHTDVSFTIAESDLSRATSVLEMIASNVGASGFTAASDIAKVSVVGTGMLGTPGVFAKIFSTLAAEDINIEMISTSEIHVTCIIERGQVERAVNALHDAFELEKL